MFNLRQWNSPFVLIAALYLSVTWRAVRREFQLGVFGSLSQWGSFVAGVVVLIAFFSLIGALRKKGY